MASRAQVLSLLCLCLATLANGYPLDAPLVDVHEPVPAVDMAKEVEKQEDKVQEQSAPVERPAADDVHEPVYPEKELPQESSSSEEVKSEEVPLDDSKEGASGPEVSFSQYDEDGDGYIDIFEWERKIEDELAKKKFLDADANDDDKISQEEYQVWSSPAAPQENVNEVYVPSDIVVQPVDEPQPPVGRSAEESGERVVIVGDLEPQASVEPEVGDVAPVAEKDLIQEQPLQPQGQDGVLLPEAPQIVAVIEEASQPSIVLLEDKKPEQPVVEAAEEVKPAVKSVDVLPESVSEEVKPEEVKKEEVVPSSSAAPLPLKEESVAVESEEKPKEQVKAEQAQPEVSIKSDVVQPAVPEVVQPAVPEVAQPAVPEVAQPAVPEKVEEKKAQVASEEKKPEVAVEDKKAPVVAEAEKVAQPEVTVVSEQPKLPEVPEKKPEVVVSEVQKLPEELKKAEVSKVEEKPSNVIRS